MYYGIYYFIIYTHKISLTPFLLLYTFKEDRNDKPAKT